MSDTINGLESWYKFSLVDTSLREPLRSRLDTIRGVSCQVKTLKVINGFEDTNTFYSISGLVLLPISGVVSGTYVAINNVYHLGEETLVCGSKNART